MAYFRGKYGPYEGFDVGDLARKRYMDLIVKKAGLWPGDRVLDVQCGYGTVSNALARHFSKCPVSACEMNDEQLDRAVENARIEGVEKRIDFVRADYTDLPYKDETFMLTTCGLGLAFEPDRLFALEEIHRVTAFYGKVLLVDLDFSKAKEKPKGAAKQVFNARTIAAMKEMGFGKITVSRADVLRDGTALVLCAAKRFDPEGEEEEDEGADAADVEDGSDEG